MKLYKREFRQLPIKKSPTIVRRWPIVIQVYVSYCEYPVGSVRFAGIATWVRRPTLLAFACDALWVEHTIWLVTQVLCKIFGKFFGSARSMYMPRNIPMCPNVPLSDSKRCPDTESAGCVQSRVTYPDASTIFGSESPTRIAPSRTNI